MAAVPGRAWLAHRGARVPRAATERRPGGAGGGAGGGGGGAHSGGRPGTGGAAPRRARGAEARGSGARREAKGGPRGDEGGHGKGPCRGCGAGAGPGFGRKEAAHRVGGQHVLRHLPRARGGGGARQRAVRRAATDKRCRRRGLAVPFCGTRSAIAVYAVACVGSFAPADTHA
uniref:Uncharacterized protein n=1 Tax=Emiliania huxleyi (strain CCMP1516) TaxID=280463 RepID=A0A0D3K3G3_EMIH1